MAALVALVAAIGGAVSATSAAAKVPVSQGPSSLLLQHSGKDGAPPVFPIDDNTPANTPEDVSFILDIRHENALENLVSNGVNGGHYLSTAQFAQQYGQSRQNIRALTSYLAHDGIHTTVMSDSLDVQANGTAGEFDNALSVHQRDYETTAIPAQHGHPAVPGKTFHGSANDPLLPRQLASFVESISA